MTPNSYREAIRISLTQHTTSDATDASAVAEATISTWHQMADEIEPVIGTGGIDVLFNRSLHLTCTVFPWLTVPGHHMDSTLLLANIKTRLAAGEAAAAAEAGITLLVTFVEILSSLIGEALTERLLARAWMTPLQKFKQETYHEEKSDHPLT